MKKVLWTIRSRPALRRRPGTDRRAAARNPRKCFRSPSRHRTIYAISPSAPYPAGANRAADRTEAKSGRGSAIRGATGAGIRCTDSGNIGSGRIAFRQRCRRSDRPPSAGITAASGAQYGYDRHVRSLHAGESVRTTGGGSGGCGCPGSNRCTGFGE